MLYFVDLAGVYVRVRVTPPFYINRNWRKTVLGPMANGIKVPCHQTLSTCERGQVLEVDKVW